MDDRPIIFAEPLPHFHPIPGPVDDRLDAFRRAMQTETIRRMMMPTVWEVRLQRLRELLALPVPKP